MAVLQGIPGLSVNVVVDGAACMEYCPTGDSSEDTPTTVTGYIKVHAGAQFEITIEFDQYFLLTDHDITVHVTVDGSTVRRPLFPKSEWKKLHSEKGIHRTIDGVRIGTGNHWTKRKLMFSTLTTGIFEFSHTFPPSEELTIYGDDTPSQTLSSTIQAKIKELGTIALTFHRTKMTTEDKNPITKCPFDNLSVVPEKVLKGKAISHSAR
jgi:hypothetical protein